MGFKKVDCVAEMEQRVKEDKIVAKYAERFDKQYELMQSIARTRKELGLTQKEISRTSGLTQQMVSRMEQVDNSPTLLNFLKYIAALGLEIKLVKKQKS